MRRCDRCGQPATHHLTLTSARTGAILVDEVICARHTELEQTLKRTALSIAGITITPLTEPEGRRI